MNISLLHRGLINETLVICWRTKNELIRKLQSANYSYPATVTLIDLR